MGKITNKEQFKAYLDSNGFGHVYDVRFNKIHASFEDSGIPTLPRLFALADALGVDPEKVTVEHCKGYGGCETCGYGGECDFEISISFL